MQGLLLFAHGARDPRWALPFAAIQQHVKNNAPQMPVELAFLEFMRPNLIDAGASLAKLGCTRVDVLPLFLGAGGHVRKDLPELLNQLSGQHPNVQWQLRAAIGEVDSVVQAMADAALSGMSK
jgi:sirohydrochlorin cobaltochelatase